MHIIIIYSIWVIIIFITVNKTIINIYKFINIYYSLNNGCNLFDVPYLEFRILSKHKYLLWKKNSIKMSSEILVYN